MPIFAAIPLTLGNLAQLVVDGVINGTGYALVAVGFGLVLKVTGRFHIAYAAIFALTALVAGQVGLSWGLPFAASLVFGVVAGVIVAVVVERTIYWPLTQRLGASALMTIFIVSLGLLTAGQGTLGLIWLHSGDSVNISGFTIQPVNVLSINTTNLALVSLGVGWIAILAVWGVIRWTKLGRMIRAVSVNPELSLAVGIDPRFVFAAVFAIGTALGGIDSVFQATQTTASPDAGQTEILYAITVAFVAPGSSPLVLAAFGVGVGLIESVSTLVVQPEWSQVVVFGVLLVYVIYVAVGQSVMTFVRRSGVRARATESAGARG